MHEFDKLAVVCHVVAYKLTDQAKFYAPQQRSIAGVSSLYNCLNTESTIQRSAIFVASQKLTDVFRV